MQYLDLIQVGIPETQEKIYKIYYLAKCLTVSVYDHFCQCVISADTRADPLMQAY